MPSLKADGDAFVPARYRMVQQPKRVADVTVVVGRCVRGRGRKSVRTVIVLNDDDVAITIIAADVAPSECAAADEDRQQRGNGACKETITCDAAPHPLGTVASRLFGVNAPCAAEFHRAECRLSQTRSHHHGGCAAHRRELD